ncbi:hypothetical protein BC834DRAFT_973196 [Gloeopeniophorella convolvens]|nr:hypothetical protein BC834DRAFT_973196 [Gloeopeniophorella convolvens]
MPSFAKVLSLAAVAFGAFVSAAPSAPRGIVDVAAETGLVGEILGHRDVVETSTTTVFSILTEAKVKIAPIVEPFNYLTSQNATVVVIKPIVAQLNVVLYDVVNDVKALVGRPVAEILVGLNGVQCTVDDIVSLLGAIITLVFDVLAKVLLVVTVDVSAILAILTPVVYAVIALVTVVLQIVVVVLGETVVSAVYTILTSPDILNVCVKLSVGSIINLIHL